MKRDDFLISRESPWSDSDVDILAVFRMWFSEDSNNDNRKMPPFSLAGVLSAKLRAERIQRLRFARELKAKKCVKVANVRAEFEAYCTLVRTV